MPRATNSVPLSRVDRRWLLKSSGLAIGAFALPQISLPSGRTASAADATQSQRRRAERAIVILLQGGCSQLESWDLKPDGPSEVRGEFKPIATRLPGLQICEHLPLLSQRAHRLSVVRSVYHATPGHEPGIHWVLTGYDYPGANLSDRNRNLNPAMGSVVSKEFGPNTNGLPTYVCIPDGGQLGNQVRFAAAHFLGRAHDPFESGLPPSSASEPFEMPPNLSLSEDVDLRRLDDRLHLLRELDQLPDRLGATADRGMENLDLHNRRAMAMLTSRATRDAFDLSKEPLALRERYGNTRVGQETILARRLAEAGVPFTLVNFSRNQEWDTHEDNFGSLKKTLLPEFDQAFSALLDDLDTRGMLESTLVAVITEFGRTPSINKWVGRDHWPGVFSIVMTGGGLKSGQVIGASDSFGAEPIERPVHINDILATIYDQLGVPLDRAHPDYQGRPIPTLPHGQPLPELI